MSYLADLTDYDRAARRPDRHTGALPHALAGILVAIAAWSLLTTTTRAADCEGVFRYLANDRLSIQEISALTNGDSLRGPGGAILVFQPTDWEEASTRGRWSLLGVLWGSFAGEGETVAGGPFGSAAGKPLARAAAARFERPRMVWC